MEKRNASIAEFDGNHNAGPHRCNEQASVAGAVIRYQADLAKLKHVVDACPRARLEALLLVYKLEEFVRDLAKFNDAAVLDQLEAMRAKFFTVTNDG